MASAIQQVSNFDLNMQNGSVLNSKILKPLDDALRCHICFDYFSNCLMTKCSHNYCSVCIRRYMAYKSQCPTCFKVATEPELQNNRLIDEILRIYKKIRETLQIPCETKETHLELPNVSQPYVEKNHEKPLKTETSSSPQMCSEVVQKNIASDEVSCPVCYKTVSSDRINIHLDSCLKQTEERKQKKFLPKLVYHLLTDKEIRKKLKEHGLSTSGDRQTLIKRHKNFIILYNANCDSLDPKPVSELLVEIERQELEERVSSSQRNTQVNKKSDASEIEKQHESYVREHQSQFSALINDVQQRAIGRNHIKEECDEHEESLSSRIVDESGKVIGESSLRIGNSSNIDPVEIKQEIDEDSEFLLRQTLHQSEKVAENSSEKKKVSDKIESAIVPSYLETRGPPTVKIKESPSLLENLSKHELLAVDSPPSSINDFEGGKIQTQMYRKRKNTRRLSNGEKGNQRKK